ncbi:hypothetical protein Mgra_00009770 [Meloidogyne graminicola]|uniref:Uncharacterized protein n=1 Tax=Meloidogyne graminicola TaxID=189291 RepID=A0A8S9ZBT6_9BILA|nr:hypothetical protein Mgra_00009770 [Meloidogyne graminicola]
MERVILIGFNIYYNIQLFINWIINFVKNFVLRCAQFLIFKILQYTIFAPILILYYTVRRYWNSANFILRTSISFWGFICWSWYWWTGQQQPIINNNNEIKINNKNNNINNQNNNSFFETIKEQIIILVLFNLDSSLFLFNLLAFMYNLLDCLSIKIYLFKTISYPSILH